MRDELAKANQNPVSSEPSITMKSLRERLMESRQVDSVIAFSERMPGAAFYPGKPKSLKKCPNLPFKTFCLASGGKLNFYCVFHDSSERIEKMMESSPLAAADWLIRNGLSFAKKEAGDEKQYHFSCAGIGNIPGGYDKAYPMASFIESDDYGGYEEFEKEQELGTPVHLDVDSKKSSEMAEKLRINKIDEIFKAGADMKNEGKTWRNEPTGKEGKWKLDEEGEQPPTAPAAPSANPAVPAGTAASPAPGAESPPAEEEPTVEEVVAEFVNAVKGKFPRLEMTELEKLILTAFKSITNAESTSDTVPTTVAEKVVKEAMKLCENYSAAKKGPGLKDLMAASLKK